jgi:serine/threonine protein kinase/Tfp pilus assembly protein PilF
MSETSPAEAIFFAALERAPGEWAALLDEACAGDADLRRRIERMLAAQSQLGGFLDQPHAKAVSEGPRNGPPEPSTEAPGAVIAGKYKLLQSIGEGGMGRVWMAEQLQPIKRHVAVKLIRTDRDSSQEILARFEAERQAIAMMDHPHIAKLLDAGTTGETEVQSMRAGRPYFVMELIKGIPLNEYCDQHKLGIADRLRLFTQVCSAVQHAHQKGIIHRDLKPTNILVEAHDDRPVPKVIDFGLAKAMRGQVLTEHTLFTNFGTVAGTPLYMAPEQATFNALDVDTRSDIYALGVILYELLTGTTPIEREQLKQTTFDEILRVIRESEPPMPSKRLGSSASQPGVAANRQMEPLKLGRFLRGDLDWIVMKALAKERDRRYETANGFARDIERFLNHEPVLAGPPSTAYRLRKFVRRNQTQVIAGCLLLLALLLGLAGTTFGLIRAEHRRLEAEQARADEAEQRTRAERARDRTRQALDAMTSSVTGGSLATQKALSDEQKKFLSDVLTYYQEFAGEKEDDEKARARTAASASRVGVIEYRLGRKTEAMAAFGLARDGYTKLVADFPDVPVYRQHLAMTHDNLGILLRNLGKGPESQEQHRQALRMQEKLAGQFPGVPAYRVELAISHDNLGNLLSDLGKRPEAEEQYRQALAIGEKLAADFPTVPEYRQHLAMTHTHLGSLLGEEGKGPEAEEQHRQALAIREKQAGKFPAVPGYRQDLAICLNNLGVHLAGQSKWPEAEKMYRKALAIEEKLVGRFPVVPEYRRQQAISHNNLGNLLNDLGKRSEAEEQYRHALAIGEKLAADFPDVPEYRRDQAGSHNSLGYLLRDLGKVPEAEKQYRQALAIREKLATEYPAVPEYRQHLAASIHNLGNLLHDLRKGLEAEKQYRKALAMQEKLLADFPTVPAYRSELAMSHNNLGILLWKLLGKRREAEEQYRHALTIREKLADDCPAVPAYRFELAISHHHLGSLFNELKKAPEAEKQYRKALAVLEKLTADFPAVPLYRQDLAANHHKLGLLLAGRGKEPEAEEQHRLTLAIQEKLAADFPLVPDYRLRLAGSHNHLGTLLYQFGKGPAAEEQYRQAMAILEILVAEFPAVPAYQIELGGSSCNLGNLVSASGRPSESLAWFEKAIRTLTAVYKQDRRLVMAKQFLRNSHLARSMTYERLQNYAEAIKDRDKAIELSANEEQPGLRAQRATLRLLAGQVAEAVAEVTELSQTPRWSAAQWYDFACVCAVASSKSTDKKEEYTDRAMALLQQAVKAGFSDAAHMAKDPDLDSLRGRDDFKKLLGELTKKTRPNPRTSDKRRNAVGVMRSFGDARK